MIRYHEHIHLSSADLALFATLTGADLPPPADVAEYNSRLRSAANTWRQGCSAEEGLLVEITEGLLLDETGTEPQALLADR